MDVNLLKYHRKCKESSPLPPPFNFKRNPIIHQPSQKKQNLRKTDRRSIYKRGRGPKQHSNVVDLWHRILAWIIEVKAYLKWSSGETKS